MVAGFRGLISILLMMLLVLFADDANVFITFRIPCTLLARCTNVGLLVFLI